MERSEAAFEAFDGVRLTLADGRVVQVPAFTTREALGYLRMLSRAEKGDEDAHYAFVKSFAVRAGLAEIPLAAFEFTFSVFDQSAVPPGEVTVAEAVSIAELLHASQQVTGTAAQMRFLDEFPEKFGLQDLRPPDVFLAGNRFVEELFVLLYGIARSFLSRLISPAEIKAMTMAGTGSGSTLASPT